MLTPGAIAFLSFSDAAKQRVLHPARVTSRTRQTLTLRCDERELPVQPSLGFRLFFEERQRFMQQAARIEEVLASDERLSDSTPSFISPTTGEWEPMAGPSVVVSPLGEPASAESRQCYRVSTVITGLRVDIADDAGCTLTDVSACGFSVISRRAYKLGTIHRITLHHEGRTFSGHGAVQSIRDLGTGKVRYGFLCADLSEKQRTPLKNGLQQISVAVQRQQLRRLAGAA